MAAPKGAKVEADWSQVNRFNDRLVRELDKAADTEGMTAAQSAAATARGAVPRRSGRLAGSIHAEPVPGDDKGGQVSYGAGVPYAGWIEHGGARPHPRPYSAKGRYLGPAAETAGEGFKRRMEQKAVNETRRSR